VDVLCAIDTLRLAATAFEVRVGHRWVFEADRRTILLRSARATSDLGSPCYIHTGTWAHPAATSAPRLGPTPTTSAPGLGRFLVPRDAGRGYGIPCRVGYRAVRDTVPCGIPCRVGYRAVRDTVPVEAPRPCSRLRAPRHRRAANTHEGARGLYRRADRLVASAARWQG
jgi:hypothetical protein